VNIGRSRAAVPHRKITSAAERSTRRRNMLANENLRSDAPEGERTEDDRGENDAESYRKSIARLIPSESLQVLR
jgi:hypothetical protein